MSFKRSYIYLLSFLEGGAVMACELIGAKMLAPYFGTSLYVWAAALGLTLGGLMSGYYLGGVLSKRSPNNYLLLFRVLVLGGGALFLMPFTSVWIMDMTLGMPVQLGAVLSLLVFMFPPLVCFGIVSPVIIAILTEQAREAGNRAGNVYAISTLGGILTTFLMGFWVIPEFGISMPAMVTGLVLAAPPAVSLFQTRKRSAALLWIVMLAGMLVSWQNGPRQQPGQRIHYHSEGIMGQIKVIDFAPFEDRPEKTYRGLVVNNTLQTVLDLQAPDQDYWEYTHVVTGLVGRFPAGSEVMVLGMGGGTLVKALHKAGYRVEANEIDARLPRLAREYFMMPDDVPVYIDDARHLIRTSTRQYDVIIYDIFRGESAPEHVLTRESLQEAMDNLKPGGQVLVNFYGYWNDDRGRIGRSVYKTLLAAGYQTAIYGTGANEDQRNLVFVADPALSDAPDDAEVNLGAGAVSISAMTADTVDAVVLTDDHPQLRLYANAAMQWRKLYNDFYTRKFIQYRFY